MEASLANSSVERIGAGSVARPRSSEKPGKPAGEAGEKFWQHERSRSTGSKLMQSLSQSEESVAQLPGLNRGGKQPNKLSASKSAIKRIEAGEEVVELERWSGNKQRADRPGKNASQNQTAAATDNDRFSALKNLERYKKEINHPYYSIGEQIFRRVKSKKQPRAGQAGGSGAPPEELGNQEQVLFDIVKRKIGKELDFIGAPAANKAREQIRQESVHITSGFKELKSKYRLPGVIGPQCEKMFKLLKDQTVEEQDRLQPLVLPQEIVRTRERYLKPVVQKVNWADRYLQCRKQLLRVDSRVAECERNLGQIYFARPEQSTGCELDRKIAEVVRSD